jgi:predicted acetyltransferase
LWHYLCQIDLSERIVARRRPLDDPLRWRLADPRQLHFDAVIDRLHLRILDVPAAFSARGYSSTGRLVLDVLPPAAGSFPGDTAPGRWVLDVSPSGTSVTSASSADPVDLRLDVTALGTIYMGGFAPSLLGAAGRISELVPGALARADALLLTQPAPHTVVGF